MEVCLNCDQGAHWEVSQRFSSVQTMDLHDSLVSLPVMAEPSI
ncbi:hypothetical protein [Chitinophaga pinensis]|nr:hypothetical protein [Chitinophaga pinensis]